MENWPRFGRPSTSATEVNIAKVKETVTANSYSTLREIAAELFVSHKSIRTILTNHLGMKHVAAQLVPNLNFLQQLNRIRVAKDMLERVNSDPTFMNAMLLVTRRGFTILKCKLVNKIRSGAFQLNRNRKTHAKLVQKSKSC
ncbi:unnamed protein product [Euphydryas editha]|uniref:Uncharacterized protein n=1 Tax=Euphydryas editha TaxID=104508 RepID=A0AAU9U7N6_EUPED|nr:unnamed protein product [Euphydryas editha]